MLVTIIWAGVALFLMLAGEYIEKKGFGNGISLILLFNILSSYPADAMTIYKRFLQGYGFDKGLRNSICICIILVVLFAFTVYIQFIEKKILVEYSSSDFCQFFDGNSNISCIADGKRFLDSQYA